MPFREEDGRVVAEAVLLVGEQVLEEAAQCFRAGVSRGGGADDEIGEAFLAEKGPVGEWASVMPSL